MGRRKTEYGPDAPDSTVLDSEEPTLLKQYNENMNQIVGPKGFTLFAGQHKGIYPTCHCPNPNKLGEPLMKLTYMT